jgi:DNA-binding transcriptional LysR family regulator
MNTELRHLRYFVTVAEELHFGRAAERLVVSQPALSRQIRDLERQLGARLFSRTSRHVELTRAGAVLLEEARLTLAQADRAVEATRRAGRGEVGHLAIGYLGSVASGLLPPLVRAFRARRPEVDLLLYEALDDKQLTAVAERHLDVGFVRSPSRRRGVRFEALQEEPLAAVLPEDHRLAAQARVSLAALADEPFILWPRSLSPAVHDDLIAACRRLGFSPRIAIEAAGATGALGLAAAGLGIAILVDSYRGLRRAGVVFVPLEEVSSTLSIAWRADNPSPVLPTFLETAREIAAGPGP